MATKAQKFISKLPEAYFHKGDKAILKEYGGYGDYYTGKGIRVSRGTICKDSGYCLKSLKRSTRKARLCGILKKSRSHDMKDPYCKSEVYEWDFDVLQGIVEGTIELPVEMLLKKRKSGDIGGIKSRDIGGTINKLYIDYKITFEIPKSLSFSKTVDNLESPLAPPPIQTVMVADTKQWKQDTEPFNKIVDNLSHHSEKGVDPEIANLIAQGYEPVVERPVDMNRVELLKSIFQSQPPVRRSKTSIDRIAA